MSEYAASVVYRVSQLTELSYGEADTLVSSYDVEHYKKIYFPDELAELIIIDWENNTNEILAVIQ